MNIFSMPTFTMLCIKDALELLCLSFLCYRWLRWLQQDKQKPLLHYFYSYCALLIISSSLQLTTMLFVLNYSAPLVMMLFVLIHQHTLQKNFVGLYKIKPAQADTADWLQHIIGFCLQAHTDLSLLLEHTTDMHELINAEISLRAPVSRELLNFIARSPDFNPEQYIYADTQGHVLGINAHWKKPLALTALDEQPIEKASYYLIDSDGCMIHYTHKTRTFTIVIKQKIYPKLSAAQVLQSMAHYLRAAENTQGTIHEARRSSSSCQPSA